MIYPPVPKHSHYDVVIVGGAMLGASVAWFLTDTPGFDGRILVIERDPTYQSAATSLTNSCMRQQFSQEINVRISQFAADFVNNFRTYMGGDPRVPQPVLHSFGYMYMAATRAAAAGLRDLQKLQARAGAGTRFLTPGEIDEAYPFYNLTDITGANHNLTDEGYFDGGTLFDWWKRSARERGAEFIANEAAVLTLGPNGRRIDSVTLASGQTISCGTLVNAAGTRAPNVAAMAGIALPIEPRKRYTFIFSAEQPLDRDLPLTIDPSGVHMRSDGRYYMAGCPPNDDPAVAPDDFTADHTLWEDKVWPALAHRIPRFEAIRLINSWVGHYDYNTLDQNAIVGPHCEIGNFIFVNGFSGHGFQQSPAMGRGVAELIAYGEYRSLDLSAFGYDRIAAGRPFIERAVI